MTARGEITSPAALVARGGGTCWTLSTDCKTLKEGDIITLNGTRGIIYQSAVNRIDATENPCLAGFMKLVDQFRMIGVRTNADTPEDAGMARKFGSEAIGLFRPEHMF